MTADAGSLPRVLLLHGLLSGPIVWNPVREALAGEARFLAPDLLGYGAARRPDCPYDLDAMVDHLAPIVARFEPTHVIGHSMGAIVGLALRARFPGQFASVGTVSIPVFASREDGRRHIGERGQLVRLFLRNHRAAHIGCRAAARTRVAWEGIANRVYPMQPEGIFRAMFHHCHEAHDGAVERVVFGDVVPELAEQPGAPVAAIHRHAG
ncbi:MAG: alpha/beta fold hydrolase [Dehalococcoidia bacterium]|nr:alpha/beta fold hydrolase [Dehalococcoidia bacterium]